MDERGIEQILQNVEILTKYQTRYSQLTHEKEEEEEEEEEIWRREWGIMSMRGDMGKEGARGGC